MTDDSRVYVGFDVAKVKHAVAVAEPGRAGELRYLGEIENTRAAIDRLVAKLARRHAELHFCYEAGPTGYGLYRQIQALGHACTVVAPSLIPKKPGERVKTNRRDALSLARLMRAGELTAVWVPDAVHEAVRDLVRAREAAAADLRRQRQRLLSFLLLHGRLFTGHQHWSLAHKRWLVEGAWSYRHPARVTELLRARLAAQPKAVRDIAWKAQTRLCARYRRLVAGGKQAPVAIAAIAREMAAFLWAIGRQVAPTA
jgi:transposase